MLKTISLAVLVGLLFSAVPAAADAVSDAAAVLRAVSASADAAAAQVPIAQAAYAKTKAAAEQAKAGMDRALQASLDADKAKDRSDTNMATAQASAKQAASLRNEAEVAARGGLCAKAKVAAAAAERAAVAAEGAADAIAADMRVVQADVTTADRAKADALAAAHRAHLTAQGAVDAYTAADKAAAAASNALANAYGRGMTVSDIGKSPGDGDVDVSDANYKLFQDAVAAAQRANSAASDVNQLRQNAINSYNEADRATQDDYNAATHIRGIQGKLIDAKNAALRAARQARADADAAKAAAAACVPPSAGEAPSPTPTPGLPGTGRARSYPSFTHRQTDCRSCAQLVNELNRAVDRYNALADSSPDKDAAWERVRVLADQLSECERRCPPDDRMGMTPMPGSDGPGPGQTPTMPGSPYGSMPGQGGGGYLPSTP